MRFTKMQGCGNDYVYINGFCEKVDDPSALAKRISDRHFGIGSDGLVMVLPSKICDIKMRMFNADGSESEMCGNAARCVGRYVYEEKIVSSTKISMETLAGIKYIKLNMSDFKLNMHDSTIESITVDMGCPKSIPTEEPHVVSVLGKDYSFVPVSMGNPHAVIFVDDVDGFPVESVGKIIECHRLFPQRTNVEFAQIIDDEHIRMRVWERGAGETMACGTGACATLAAAAMSKLTKRKATLKLNGGELLIEWDQENDHIFMTGPAVRVFDGTLY